MDLFELGSGTQVHDFNGGILPSGLFWTVALPDGAFTVSEDGQRAALHVENLPLIDNFRFLGPNETLATVSLSVAWEATGPELALGSGADVEPNDPAAFLGTFREAHATGAFSGSELGFSFESLPGASSDTTFAMLGRERNGVFLT